MPEDTDREEARQRALEAYENLDKAAFDEIVELASEIAGLRSP